MRQAHAVLALGAKRSVPAGAGGGSEVVSPWVSCGSLPVARGLVPADCSLPSTTRKMPVRIRRRSAPLHQAPLHRHHCCCQVEVGRLWRAVPAIMTMDAKQKVKIKTFGFRPKRVTTKACSPQVDRPRRLGPMKVGARLLNHRAPNNLVTR